MSLFRRWALPALVMCLAALPPALGAGRAADDAPPALDAKAVDAFVHKTLREVINEGADMYNAQGRYKNADRDYAGCFHLYEGALMVTRPLLAGHPDLQKAIDEGLESARDTPRMEMRAFVLRSVIDKIREAVNPTPKETVTPPPPPVKEARSEGKVVGAEKGKLSVSVDGKDKTFAVPDTAKVIIDEKDGKLENVKKDSAVVVTEKGDVVTRVEAKSPAAPPPPPPPPPPPVKETKAEGKAVKAEKGKLTASVNGEDKTFNVPDSARVTIDDKDGKLEDVKKDSAVVVTEKGDAVTKVEAKSPAAPPPPPLPPPPQTLWDRLGGEGNVAKVVDDFVNTAGKDPKVNFFRDPTHTPSKEELATLKKKLVEYVSSISGGPLKYDGKNMKDVHAGMKITNEEFDASVKDLKDALEKNGAKAEDVKTVLGVVEGTRKDIVEEKKTEDKDKPKPPEEKKAGEAGHVHGKVTYKDKPASGNTIGLLGRDYKYIEVIGADGTYQIKDDIKPGVYAVVVGENLDKPNPAAVKIPAQYLDPEKSGLTVEVKKGEQTHDIDLKDMVEDKKPEDKPRPEDKSGETGSVKGKVTYKGQPVSNGLIVFDSKDGITIKTDLGADGSYKIKAPPGEYAVAVDTSAKLGDPSLPNAGAGATPKKYADPKTSGLTVEIKKGEQTRDINLKD